MRGMTVAGSTGAVRGPRVARAAWPLAVVAITLLVTIASPGVVRGQMPPTDFMDITAELAATPLVAGETTRGAIELDVLFGYHVNANPATYDYLIPTTVEVAGVEGVTIDAAFYPVPVMGTFAFATEPLAVYEDVSVAGFELRVGDDVAAGVYGLEIVVRYQACNTNTCFAPTEARTTVFVEIAAAGTPVLPTGSDLVSAAPFPEASVHED